MQLKRWDTPQKLYTKPKEKDPVLNNNQDNRKKRQTKKLIKIIQKKKKISTQRIRNMPLTTEYVNGIRAELI
jgi:hypothetical protein